jgi:penicillin-binding protein 1A
MKPGRKKLLKTSLLVLSALAAAALLFVGILFLFVLTGITGPLPGRAELADIQNEEASLVFSSDSLLIGKYFAKNRTNIDLHDVPQHLIDALIATEDQRFFSHKGYDTKSYARVLLKTILLRDRSSGGGSTITQQLVKNLYGRDKYGLFSLVVNKMRELIIAARIEKAYSKQEILLLYLNSVPFGEDTYGVESAARRFFSKSTSQLNIEESAVLVGMLRANTRYNPVTRPENALARRNVVLQLLGKAHHLDTATVDSLLHLPLETRYENINNNGPAGYFVYQVRKKATALLDSINNTTGSEYDLEKDGLEIHTTLNYKIQQQGNAAVKGHLGKMQKLLDRELGRSGYKAQWLGKMNGRSTTAADTTTRNMQLFDWEGLRTVRLSRTDSLWHYHKMLNASVLIMDPKNGDVLSWIGGNHFRLLPFDMVLSRRQSASAFKPLLYATALESGISPCTYLDNDEQVYNEYDDWAPGNADHTSTPDSTVALWYALAHSMNLPTVDLYFRVGEERLRETLNRLRLPALPDSNPSAALGSLDLSLYELTRAYSAFANGGQMTEPVMINTITDDAGNIVYAREQHSPTEVFSTETAELTTAILQQVIEQGTATGMRKWYGVNSELAGKTGTAQNYSDAWFIAYTPDLVIGTWVGTRMPEVHFAGSQGSGSALAMPIVAKMIRQMEHDPLLSERYLTPFDLPVETYSFLECEPYYMPGIRGILDRLFRNRIERDSLYREERLKYFRERDEDDRPRRPLFRRRFRR